MYGFNHIPLAQRAIQVDEFVGLYGDTGANSSETHLYTVPRGASFLYIFLVGSGGNGATPTVGAGVSGGGGGGSASITKALIPTILIPNTLNVYVSSASNASSRSMVTINARADTDVILATYNGRGAITGSAGAGGAVMTVTAAPWAGSLALWVSQAGATAGAGSTTNGAAVTALATLPLTGGGGGGGSSAGTGGNVTGAGPFPTITGGASGANPGRAGMMLRQPFGGVGGSGGGGVNAAGTGLNFGGAGAIGCGGGGGGNAASGTPGAGGKGGPGYCLIVAF